MLNKNRLKKILLSGLIIGMVPLCIGCEDKKVEVKTTTTKVVEKEEVIDHFKVYYEGVDVTPGNNFTGSTITSKEAKLSTITSCAGFGKDNVYTYDNVEITANVNDDEHEEIIYSVYFINNSVSNKDGLKIGLSIQEMKNILGEEDDEFNGVYTYNGESIYIKIQTKEEKITSIEYIRITN